MRPLPRDVWISALAALAAAVAPFHPLLVGKVIGSHVASWLPVAGSRPAVPAYYLGDIELQMLPFLCQSQREYARGRIPLWNPYQGTGAPHLANETSAALHPLVVAALALPFRYSLTFLTLAAWALGYAGMWLLARDLGHSGPAADLAAASYALSGGTIAWMAYSMGGVLAHAPLCLVLSRRLGRSPSAATATLLGATLASTVLCGHFEYLPLIWGAAAVVALAAGRSARPLPHLTLAILGAALFSAAFLLPCAEYLAQSRALERVARGDHVAATATALLCGVVDPTPLTGWAGHELHASGIIPQTAAGVYVGSLALVLAAIGLADRRALRLNLGATIALALIVPGPVAHALRRLPLLSLMHFDRLGIVANLAIALLAARGAEKLALGKGRGAALLALSGAAVVLALEGWIYSGFEHLPAPHRWLALAAGALLVAALLARSFPRPALPALGFVLLVLEHAWGIGGFLRWERPQHLFPESRLLDEVSVRVGHERIVGEGPVLGANTATVYGLRDMRLYDAIGVRGYEGALVAERSYSFFGSRDVLATSLSREAGAAIHLRFPSPHPATAQEAHTLSVPIPSAPDELAQSFRARRGDASSLSVRFQCGAREGCGTRGRLVVTLARVGPPKSIIGRWKVRPDPSLAGGWKTLPIEPLQGVQDGELLAITVTALDTDPGMGLAAAPRRRGPALVVNGRPRPLSLAYRLDYGAPSATFASAEGILACRDAAALPRGRLEGELGRRDLVRFELDEATRVKLLVRAPRAGRIILADAAYPGWEAVVDGRSVASVAAGPFRAVSVAGGEHHVQWDYRPFSFRTGLFVTCLTLLGLFAKPSRR